MRPDKAVLNVPAKAVAASSSRASVASSTNASRLTTLPIGRRGLSAARRTTKPATPAIAKPIMNTKNSQPIGEALKACKLLKTPLRVRNVAKLHTANVAIARQIAVFFNTRACCQAIIAWIRAVPVSHGISDPFSTGSQPQ